MTTAPPHGSEARIAGLERCGANPAISDGVVTFDVVPVAGAHAGQTVRSGISADEAGTWPAIPPHWVHLPATITLTHTNTQPSPLPSWLMHSRNITGWGNATDPAQAWLAHIRSVLSAAT